MDPDYDYMTFPEVVASAVDAYAQAGIKDPRQALAMAEVHDCFTRTELVLMEDLGFAARGTAWKEVLAGTFDLDGELAVTRQEVVHPGRPGESSGCQVITHPDQEAWMNIHKNARLTPYRRQELVARVERGEPVTAVARAFGVSRQTARKWVVRKRDAGVVDSTAWAGDGSSRPDHSPRQTEPKIQLAIKVLRWQRWTCRQIAGALAIDTSTAARILRRVGLSRRPRLEPPATVQRYEHAAVGDLLHLDMKKLGRITSVGHRMTGDRRRQPRGAGWEFVHVAVDDYSRVAYVELLADERTESVRGFVRRALAWFRARGARIRRVLTDNGSAYLSRGFRATCRALHLAHRRTRPYTPRTNGKAERFIQTLLREWAYLRPYYTSADRTRVLPGWLEHYNCARPHAALGKQPPMSRFPGGNNLMRAHS